MLGPGNRRSKTDDVLCTDIQRSEQQPLDLIDIVDTTTERNGIRPCVVIDANQDRMRFGSIHDIHLSFPSINVTKSARVHVLAARRAEWSARERAPRF